MKTKRLAPKETAVISKPIATIRAVSFSGQSHLSAFSSKSRQLEVFVETGFGATVTALALAAATLGGFVDAAVGGVVVIPDGGPVAVGVTDAVGAAEGGAADGVAVDEAASVADGANMGADDCAAIAGVTMTVECACTRS